MLTNTVIIVPWHMLLPWWPIQDSLWYSRHPGHYAVLIDVSNDVSTNSNAYDLTDQTHQPPVSLHLQLNAHWHAHWQNSH